MPYRNDLKSTIIKLPCVTLAQHGGLTITTLGQKPYILVIFYKKMAKKIIKNINNFYYNIFFLLPVFIIFYFKFFYFKKFGKLNCKTIIARVYLRNLIPTAASGAAFWQN